MSASHPASGAVSGTPPWEKVGGRCMLCAFPLKWRGEKEGVDDDEAVTATSVQQTLHKRSECERKASHSLG